MSRHSGRLDFISRFSQTKVKIHGSEAGLQQKISDKTAIVNDSRPPDSSENERRKDVISQKHRDGLRK